MRPNLILSICFLFLQSFTPVYAEKGSVVYTISGCDYFVVHTSLDYAVLEWYGGHEADKGDVLIGKFNGYGMRDIFDYTADEEMRVWVEDYLLSKEGALEKLADHCN